ncbi:GNAT family N-acetyltransferase [Bacillus suaedae]|uniref:GNAT family N-acetyltransferase n=1 Tax=Halalkalibacter suaedae TaxID=2822140 RepID=A0A941AQS6_9BACI|nr:GNAT family N-acetyltransferase [Bacillus suaedae]MBP3951568.1 GNAT family N-acetyltransferase [Bacillus suaedae]
MLFKNGDITVRKLEVSDKYLLAKWLSDPTILEFYEGRDQQFDLDKVTRVFYTLEEEEVKCIVEYQERAIGYIQFYQLDDLTKEEYGYGKENMYGIDQFIGEAECWNKGIGTLLVTSMAAFLSERMEANKIVVDPQSTNLRAIACYEKCGFKKVKFLPKRELHEGEYRDCWLMVYQSV